MSEVRIVYNFVCYYWAVIDAHGCELFGATTFKDAENWIHDNY